MGLVGLERGVAVHGELVVAMAPADVAADAGRLATHRVAAIRAEAFRVTPERYHMDRVAQCGCIVCRRAGFGWVPCVVHHVASGSGERSDFATAGLCPGDHVGPLSIHKAKERFLKVHRVPWEIEEGLLVWQAEDLALLAMGRLPLGVA